MGTDEVIEFLQHTDTVSADEKWQVFHHMLENCNDTQWHFLYRMLDTHYKINSCKRNVKYGE